MFNNLKQINSTIHYANRDRPRVNGKKSIFEIVGISIICIVVDVYV